MTYFLIAIVIIFGIIILFLCNHAKQLEETIDNERIEHDADLAELRKGVFSKPTPAKKRPAKKKK